METNINVIMSELEANLNTIQETINFNNLLFYYNKSLIDKDLRKYQFLKKITNIIENKIYELVDKTTQLKIKKFSMKFIKLIMKK